MIGLRRLAVILTIIVACAPAALAQTPTVVNFEQFTAGDVFTGIQAPLTVGNATFSGGQLLNATTFLPADPSVVYGTGSDDPAIGLNCVGCLSTITIDFAQPVSNFSLLLLNGNTVTVTYTVMDNQGGTRTITLPPNFDSGAGTVSIPDSGILRVTISSGVSPWDFFIDNVTFTQCSASSVKVLTNENCKTNINPKCTANIVLANGSETTGITTSVKPAQAIKVDLSSDFGSVPSQVQTDSSGSNISDFTAGQLPFGFSDTTTRDAKITAKVCGQSFSNAGHVYNYDAFNFHSSQVSDSAFRNSGAMSASQIQSFFASRNSFLAEFRLVGRIGGFVDLNGNGALDPGEPVYKAGTAPIPLHIHGLLASLIFARQAASAGINPEVLLATAQKETSVIGKQTLPSNALLNNVMNCGTASNFVAQISCAATTLTYWFGKDPSEPYFFHASAGIEQFVNGEGRKLVGFSAETAATYTQYKYTPFIQYDARGSGVYLFEKVWAFFGF